ncbi:hypothetical protein BDV33DRAFT_210982 [Aspergillus novoparasiticus]|uniref:GAG-pre-integrase domain-containing protein n=1 Tax=Aspergillus novoparasiticus TaxID=986946 RepID=A0A5N6E574_9EURO|nr:hypothetical protein BDV33DRAFT_210982 [Aspergillus novoparasiticus]
MNLVSVSKPLRDCCAVVAPTRNLLARQEMNHGEHPTHRRRFVGLHFQASRRPVVQIYLARKATDSVASRELSDADMIDGYPRESSSSQRAATTSELRSDDALANLEEDTSMGVDQVIPEEPWHSRLGHLNRGDLRAVLRASSSAAVSGVHGGDAASEEALPSYSSPSSFIKNL